MNKPTPIPSRERVAKRRAALRAQGLRPKQFWVPDVNSREFRAEAKKEALAIANSDREAEHLAWVESLIDWDAFPLYDATLRD